MTVFRRRFEEGVGNLFGVRHHEWCEKCKLESDLMLAYCDGLRYAQRWTIAACERLKAKARQRWVKDCLKEVQR